MYPFSESISVRLPRSISCAVDEKASDISVAIVYAPANAAFEFSVPARRIPGRGRHREDFLDKRLDNLSRVAAGGDLPAFHAS
jgi:hypothetical protein